MTTRTAGPTLPRPDAGPVSHNVVAAFPTIESARVAADALGVALIPANRISLIPAEEGMAGQWPAAYSYDERRYVSSTVSSGAILGALLGGVGSLVLAGAISSIANAELSAVVLLAVGVFGAVGVGALGGFMSGSTFDQPASSGPAAGSWPKISVECESGEQLESAIEILREKGPLELYRGEEQLV
jgi:hypothetical protein